MYLRALGFRALAIAGFAMLSIGLDLIASSACAQANPATPARPAANRSRVAPPKGFRKLAAGIETTISPQIDPNDAVTQHDIVEIQSAGKDLDWKPATESTSRTLKEAIGSP